MHYSYYGFRLFLNLAITGHSWHLALTTFFSSNQSLILTVLAAIPSVAHISNPEQGRRHRGWKNSKGRRSLLESKKIWTAKDSRIEKSWGVYGIFKGNSSFISFCRFDDGTNWWRKIDYTIRHCISSIVTWLIMTGSVGWIINIKSANDKIVNTYSTSHVWAHLYLRCLLPSLFQEELWECCQSKSQY